MPWLQSGTHMSDVGIPAAGVHHDEQATIGSADDQIVENAALIVGEDSVAGMAGLQSLDIAGNQPLEGVRDNLSHVGHIKEPGLLTAMAMLGHNTGKLDRQRPAGEIHHLAAKFDMEVVKRGGFRGVVFSW